MNRELKPRADTLGTAFFSIFLAGSLAQATNAQIFVVNSDSGTIASYSFSGEPINTRFISGLSNPSGIAISGDRLYVSAGNAIKEYTTSGTLVNASLISGLNNWPYGLAVSGGYLYVANVGSAPSTVAKYTTSGSVVSASLITGLSHPVGLALDGDYLYVSEYSPNGRVGKYTTSGETINASLIPDLNLPGGLALDGTGKLFVSSWGPTGAGTQGTLGVYTTSGEEINALLVTNGWNTTISLAFNVNGNLLWGFNGGPSTYHAISEYTTSGQPVHSPLITGLNNPSAIAIIPEPSPALLIFTGVLVAWKRRRLAHLCYG